MKTAIYDKNGIKIAGDSELSEKICVDFSALPKNEEDKVYNLNSDGTLTVILYGERKNESKQITKNDFVRNLLLGKFGNDVKTLCGKYGLQFEEPRRVFVAEVNDDILSYVSVFEESFENDDVSVALLMTNKIAFVCPEEDMIIDETASAFGATFAELNMDYNIGVGCVSDNAAELWESYEQANIAIEVGSRISFSGGVWKFADVLPELIISNLPENSVSEVKEKAQQIKRVLGQDDIELVQEFFKHDLNISETARCCYLHRNALIYRLDKIQRETGLNMRKFDEAVAMRLYISANKIIK